MIYLFGSCASKYEGIYYRVILTPIVDSMPCKASIEYSAWYDKEMLDFEGKHWQTIKKVRIDTYVTLKATGNYNVESIEITIGGYKNEPTIVQCTDANCSAEGRYDLYGYLYIT